MEKLVSIIVPIYNAEPYLKKCFYSILAQTYQNLEVILVNDGSTDRSAHICREFQQFDRRVKFIQKENGGLVSARKAGIAAASGSFVGFVDADDWIEPGYFLEMMEAQKISGAEIVACNHFHEIGTISKKVGNGIPAGVYKRDLILPKLIYSGVFFEFGLQSSLCTKLIHKEILKKTQTAVDNRVFLGEDAAAFYPSVLEANKIAVTDICAYHYVQHQGSMMKTINEDEWERFGILIDHLNGVFQEKGVAEIMRPQLKQYQKFCLLLRNIQALDQGILSPYGEIPLNCRIVIYGAGGLGQQLYQYLTAKKLANILMWVDQNDGHYRKSGLDVYSPEAIKCLQNQYDYILIANTLETTAKSIHAYLLSIQVPEEKIRWLSKEFLELGIS